MAHLHTQIRTAVKTALTGLATTGARVWANRVHPLADSELPGLNITVDAESAEPMSIHPSALAERTLTLSVQAAAKGRTGLDDTLDQIALEVEQALAAGVVVGGRTLQPIYTGMEFDDAPLDAPSAVKRLSFSLTYHSAAGAPDTLS